ncbi:MAG: hypothetical protein CL878_04300 [Dehalococcoidia bacterium]|nr:hypothetical protein [Dehalococcoidia bacterium]
MPLNYLRHKDPEHRLLEYERDLSDRYVDAITHHRLAEAQSIWELRERVRKAAHREDEEIAPPHSEEDIAHLHDTPITS